MNLISKEVRMFYQDVLKKLFWSGIKAVNPYKAVKETLKEYQEEIRRYKNIIVIGFGKAACPMARAVEEMLLEDIKEGLVITKYKHGQALKKIKIIEAGHPVPDANGVRGTEKILSIIKTHAKENTLGLCLISGGGSALFVAPYKGITLKEKQAVTQLLLKAGADIYELNAVRKHLSKVKGGRLAEKVYPARLISFILSDVIGDRLDVIASGPTAPDETTYQDAWEVLERHNLLKSVSPQVLNLLEKGKKGLIPETLKAKHPVFKKVSNIIVGSNRKVLKAIKKAALKQGFVAEVISSDLQGEAKEVAKQLAKLAIEKQAQLCEKTKCLISGGETTVTVKGNGLGGRNMELALAFALEIAGKKGISLLSAGSDGTDGPTDAAGAIVDGKTVIKAQRMGIDPKAYLENNDSYHFFQKVGGLFVTGPTGTNVMDIQIILIK